VSAEALRVKFKDSHIGEWHRRTINVNIPTPFKEILGSFGGVQYDDNLPENMERYNFPYRFCQRRRPGKEKSHHIFSKIEYMRARRIALGCQVNFRRLARAVDQVDTVAHPFFDNRG
jgi:hypothetical protein